MYQLRCKVFRKGCPPCSFSGVGLRSTWSRSRLHRDCRCPSRALLLGLSNTVLSSWWNLKDTFRCVQVVLVGNLQLRKERMLAFASIRRELRQGQGCCWNACGSCLAQLPAMKLSQSAGMGLLTFSAASCSCATTRLIFTAHIVSPWILGPVGEATRSIIYAAGSSEKSLCTSAPLFDAHT